MRVGYGTTITIGAVGYQGKVKAANTDCLEERPVILKQKGNGVLSRVETKPNGNCLQDDRNRRRLTPGT